MRLIPADGLSTAQLAALFNAAYSDYFDPLAMDENDLERHVVDNDIDLRPTSRLRLR